MPISKVEGWYDIDSYKAVLTPYPPIEHGTYNGIDTKVLDDKLRRIDWHNDGELFYFIVNTEPEFVPEVNEISEQINCLRLDPAGASVADKLMLKYWSDATFFEGLVPQSAWDYLDSLPKREQIFPTELEAKTAFNLLFGRAFLRNRVYPLPYDKPAWVRFDFTTKNADGGYLTEIMPAFTEDQLESVLSTLPIPDEMYHQVIYKLTRGDICKLSLPNGKKLFLEANPEQQKVNIYSEDMRLIPFNLHFDPDWKPTPMPEIKPEELKRKPRQNIIPPGDPPGKNKRFGRRR